MRLSYKTKKLSYKTKERTISFSEFPFHIKSMSKKNDATSQGTSLQSNQVSWCASYVSIILLDIDPIFVFTNLPLNICKFAPNIK